MKMDYILSAICLVLIFASAKVKSPWLGVALAVAGVALAWGIIKEVKAWRTTT